MKRFLCLLIMSFSLMSCNSQEEINTISIIQLKSLMAQEKIQLLDVRTPDEIERGFIKTAKFANFYDEDFYEKAVQQLDKTKTVYLYCRSGSRSGKAALILKNKGYTAVNVLGGFNQWKKEN